MWLLERTSGRLAVPIDDRLVVASVVNPLEVEQAEPARGLDRVAEPNIVFFGVDVDRPVGLPHVALHYQRVVEAMHVDALVGLVSLL